MCEGIRVLEEGLTSGTLMSHLNQSIPSISPQVVLLMCRGQFFEVGLIAEKTTSAAKMGMRAVLCPPLNAERDRIRSHPLVSLISVADVQGLLEEAFEGECCVKH